MVSANDDASNEPVHEGDDDEQRKERNEVHQLFPVKDARPLSGHLILRVLLLRSRLLEKVFYSRGLPR